MAPHDDYEDIVDQRIFNLAPTSLFSGWKLTIISGEPLEWFD